MYCAQRIIHFRPRVSAHAFSARARLLAGPPRRPSLQLRAWTKLSSQVLGMVVRVCVYIYIYICAMFSASDSEHFCYPEVGPCLSASLL